jgi:hypothetical protein
MKNNGLLRYTDVHEADGSIRQPVDDTFATNTNTPELGMSVFGFSEGHGGLQCAACHGSAHAELPSREPNENTQSIQLQGYEGVLSDCSVCHTRNPSNDLEGPHGMHPIGQSWVNGHERPAERNSAQCRLCHGKDFRGTELSRSLSDKTLNAFGSKHFWKGFQVGCYNCHNGPTQERASNNRAPVVQHTTISVTTGEKAQITLNASDSDRDPLSLRIVQQPMHGTVSLSDNVATYHADLHYAGPDSFTYAAWDGDTNSNLGEASVTVSDGTGSLSISALAPAVALQGSSTPFRASGTWGGHSELPSFVWTLDESIILNGKETCHTFNQPGNHTWSLKVRLGETEQSINGAITIEPNGDISVPVFMNIELLQSGNITISWPVNAESHQLQHAVSPANGVFLWEDIGIIPSVEGNERSVTLPSELKSEFFRLHQP